jgi:hypothetical protein
MGNKTSKTAEQHDWQTDTSYPVRETTKKPRFYALKNFVFFLKKKASW